MLTQICTLTSPDGKTLTATVQAAAPEQDPQITYTGHPELLATLVPGMFQTASPAFLETYFRVLAQENGFRFTSSFTGEYDHFAA